MIKRYGTPNIMSMHPFTGVKIFDGRFHKSPFHSTIDDE